MKIKLVHKIIALSIVITTSCLQKPDVTIDPGSNSEILKGLIDRSDSLLDQNDLELLTQVLSKALTFSQDNSDSSLVAALWNNIGILNFKIGNQDSSLIAYNLSLQFSESIGNLKRKAITLKNKAISHKAKGQFQKALSNYIESLVIMRSKEDSIEIASINNGIGNIYNSLRQYDKALNYLNEAKEIWSIKNSSNKVVLAMGNLGNTYLGLNELDSAVNIYKNTLLLKRSIGNKHSIAITLNNLGEAFLLLKRFSEAETCFLESIKLRNEAKRVSGISLVANNLASLELKKGNPLKAQEWLDRALNIIEDYPAADKKIENLRLQREVHAQSNNFQAAYMVGLKYDELRESFFEQETRKVQKEQYDFDLDQEEKSKELYKARYEASEAQREAESLRVLVQTYVLIIIVLIAIIIGYFAYKLRKQNKHIENLMRELHHRVKNHLGMISGMFGAQSEGAEGSNSDLLEEAKARVEAVNGIHRRLYRQDEYEFVNMKEYLTELVDNSALVFGLFGNIDKQLDIQNEPLEIDKAISVGLIANEVLTNAFKYGLQKTKEPVLKIVLEKAVKGYRMLIYNNATPESQPVTESTGFGKELIKRLTANLKGEAHTIQQNGFHFELTFP